MIFLMFLRDDDKKKINSFRNTEEKAESTSYRNVLRKQQTTNTRYIGKALLLDRNDEYVFTLYGNIKR